MTRLNFTDAQRTEALKRANFTCQAVDCGCTFEWTRIWGPRAELKLRIRTLRTGERASLGWLAELAAQVRKEAERSPKACEFLLTRYRFRELSPDALLQVDHIREAADGGAATLENAQVLCIVCHLDKTATRGRVRRKGPKVAQKYELLRRVG